ncbi:CAI-1 autoinducer sensor kinase/phosphatase CqsS [Pseudodesulfovibrio hydrargyri]|uniref:CAI-1 autoinducer sensor kinase/phosphatase CqsS n=1 Tax=Pseudodesulfovibrio hydrargyri TaxID=2125990 RepID=A0A1J5NAL3_9BACT|nr:response regulator [Pseudodesulfovibrio hydrargyri]OIQ51872.1 CAI-1 autoinducer sensor kinase/phosphatase CqsS [Pseudodesulfovibrio hydrargyri]
MRFLIVDDDESIHLFMQVILAPYGECATASTGERAVEMFARARDEGRPFDVVLMDILMPGMDGHQAAELMRAREMEDGVAEADSFKLAMITCVVDDTSVDKAFFNTRACIYIVKPLDRHKVVSELREHFII